MNTILTHPKRPGRLLRCAQAILELNGRPHAHVTEVIGIGTLWVNAEFVHVMAVNYSMWCVLVQNHVITLERTHRSSTSLASIEPVKVESDSCSHSRHVTTQGFEPNDCGIHNATSELVDSSLHRMSKTSISPAKCSTATVRSAASPQLQSSNLLRKPTRRKTAGPQTAWRLNRKQRQTLVLKNKEV